MRITTNMLRNSSLLGTSMLNGLMGSKSSKTMSAEKASKYANILKNSAVSGRSTDDRSKESTPDNAAKSAINSGITNYNQYGSNGLYGNNNFLSSLLSSKYNFWF